MLHVIAARVTDAHRLWLAFNDGASGEIDLAPYLDGPLFEPLKRSDYFATATLDLELATVSWPNGADFAPEFLRELLSPEAPSGLGR
jgi:hypothetical protein